MRLLLPLVVLVPLAAWAAQAEPQPQPQPRPQPPPARAAIDEREEEKPAEPLPEYPKADPQSKVASLNKEKNDKGELDKNKSLVLEVLPEKKGRRVGFVAEVCRREGPLEVFLCRRGTKEHEAVLRTELNAQDIHTALILANAEPGKPAQFVNPKTEEPEFKPATGTKVKISVHYKMDGKLHTRPAQEWVWNKEKKKPLETDWVFAGSMLLKSPDNPDQPPYYAANSGDVISISNFPYAMLDVTTQIGMDDANINYEPKTDRVPPLLSKVWVILEPVPEKKK